MIPVYVYLKEWRKITKCSKYISAKVFPGIGIGWDFLPFEPEFMFSCFRWLDQERPHLYLERRGCAAVCRQPLPARRLQDGQQHQQVLRRGHGYWGVLLPQGGPCVRPGALLLHRHHLRPLLHDRGRLLVLILA